MAFYKREIDVRIIENWKKYLTKKSLEHIRPNW
jgi:hypothetical protein